MNDMPTLFDQDKPKVYYKYRSLKNFAHFADIIINNRLYAAKFKDLNDPMEGNYFYSNGSLQNFIIRKLKDEKRDIKICSLSKQGNNSLLFTQYADEHKGIVIELNLIDDLVYKIKKIEDINYVERLRNIHTKDYIEGITPYLILTEKLQSWSKEKEVRVFTISGEDYSYVKVDIKKIYAGVKMSKSEFENLEAFIKICNKDIEVVRMGKRELV